MARIEIPLQFHRNSQNVLALGVENTGAAIIRRGNELLGRPDLSGLDVLDIGCGVRFTQTIINLDLPVGSYTGIDIDEPLIRYLADNVSDARFSFHRWNAHNAMYNPAGEKLGRKSELPFSPKCKFDVIWMYSVITHNCPEDTEYLLHMARKCVRADGGLLFSAFVDNAIETFEDKVKDHPLLNAYYNEGFLRKIAARAGWRVESIYDKWADSVSQDLFLCRPRRRFWGMF